MTQWPYGAITEPQAYGENTTYELGLSWLDGRGPVVEDWGCGTAYGRRFVTKSEYVGIDGTDTQFNDVTADLCEYRSNAAGIFIRHVLEHNYHWDKILGNAMASFKKRLVVVLFTPFAPETRVLSKTWNQIPDLAFKREDITAFFGNLLVHEEHLKTFSQFGVEHIFYVERP